MKKLLIPVFVVMSVMLGTFFYMRSQNAVLLEKQKVKYANAVGRERFLNVLSAFMIDNADREILPCTLKHGRDSILLNQIIDYPCLVVYIPEAENTCMSCINYAISSANGAFTDSEWRSRLCFISFKCNPELKERVIKKEVYSIEEMGVFGEAIEKQPNPVYLLIGKDHRVISSFIPNADFEELTQSYLSKAYCLIRGV